MKQYKHICLINPPHPGLREPTAYPPLGLLYIAAYLWRSRISSEVVNLAGLPMSEDLVKHLPESKVYGISMHHATATIVRDMVKLIKSSRPDSVVILGGPECIHDPQKVERNIPLADYIVDGEGEYATSMIMWGEIDKDVKVLRVPRIVVMDDLPFPARHLLPEEYIVSRSGIHWIDTTRKTEPATTILTSRGCPYKCAFCSKIRIMRGRWCPRSARNVFEEFEQVIQAYGVKRFRILDDVFNLNHHRTMEICRLLEPLGVTFCSAVRADSLQDMPTLHTLRSAGFNEVLIGVESPTQRILDSIQKDENIATIEQAFANCREADIKTKALLIFGLPGETLETVQAIKDFMIKVKPDSYTLSTFTPLPGSAIYANPEAFGVKLSVDKYSGWFYHEPGEEDDMPEYLSQEVQDCRSDLIAYLRSEEWRQ